MLRNEALTSRISIPALSRRHLLIVAGTIAAAVLTALATSLKIPLPFSPVPVTGQTMTVLIAGALLGPMAGSLSQVLFLALGATGATAFAGGALSGVTGGYLIGFVFAAFLVGAVARRTDSTLAVGAAMAAGSAVILIFGAAWLCIAQGMSVTQALTLGVLPYLAGDAMKVFGALAVWRGSASIRRALTGGSDAE
ncbi:MAG: biotin transporter BioY [Armatimonadota bacterium]